MCSTEILVPIPSMIWDNNAVPAEGHEHVVAAGEHYIPIDECIVPAVKALWAAGVVTLSSCCGHVQEGDEHPYGVITIQTRPGVAQRGATLLRRERYEDLLAAAARERALVAENARLRAALEGERQMTALIDGVGRIAERRMGICPLCDEHWNRHAMTCPIRPVLLAVYPAAATAQDGGIDFPPPPPPVAFEVRARAGGIVQLTPFIHPDSLATDDE